MFVGRTVCGLPYDSHEFSILPPHFKESSPQIDKYVQVCFPGMPANLNRVGEFTLASLVYHSGFLRRTLERTHPIFLTALFQDPDLLITLSPLVVCGSTISESRIQPTGIPPHISLLRESQNLKTKLLAENQDLKNQIQAAREGIVRDLTLQLDRRELGTGGISYHGVRSLFQEMIHELRDTRARPLPDRPHSPEEETRDSGANEDAQSDGDGDAPRRSLHYWGDAIVAFLSLSSFQTVLRSSYGSNGFVGIMSSGTLL